MCLASALLSSVAKLYKHATSDKVCFALATGLRLFVQSAHAAHVKADQALRQLVGDLVASAKVRRGVAAGAPSALHAVTLGVACVVPGRHSASHV